jgi:hypothetical protein
MVPVAYQEARSRNTDSEAAGQERLSEDQSHPISVTCSMMVEKSGGNLEEVHTLRSFMDAVRGYVEKRQRQ